MQKFVQRPVAVAVGTALAAFAGASIAQTAVTARAGAAAVLADNGLSQTERQQLFSARGVSSDKLKLKLYVSSNDSQGIIVFQDSTLTTGAATPVIGDSTMTTVSSDSANHFLVTANDSVGPKLNLANRLDGATAITSDSANSQVPFDTAAARYKLESQITGGSITANERFRVDSTGKVQYSVDSGATWLNVKVRLQNSATEGLGDSKGFFSDRNGDSSMSAADTTSILKTFDSTDVLAGHTLIPQPKQATAAKDSAALVTGLSIETFGTALSALDSTKIRMFTVAVDSGATSFNNNDSGTTTNTTIGGLIGATVSTAGSKFTISFDSAGSNDWGPDNSAADAANFGAKYFNTGISYAGATNTVPFRVNIVSGQSPVYGAAVGESTGSNAYLFKYGAADSTLSAALWPGVTLDSNASIADGALPVVTSANYNKTGKTLKILFSEPIQGILDSAGTTNDIAEANEYVSFGTATAPTSTLAAANFNVDGKLRDSTSGVSNSNGVGTLTLSEVPEAFLSQRLHVAKRITLAEPNENGGFLNDSSSTTLDAAGFKTKNDEVLVTAGSVTINPAISSLSFDEETSARAFLKSSTDTAVVEKIVVKYPFKVKFDSTAIVKDHFLLEAVDSNNVVPQEHKIFLDSNAVSILADGTLQVAVSPNLVQRNIAGFRLSYDTSWGDGKGVLLFDDSADTTTRFKVVGTGTQTAGASSGVSSLTGAIDSTEISLPLTFNKTPMFTMETELALTGSIAADSKVTTYIAKWLDVASSNRLDSSGAAHGYLGGNVTNGNDRVVTNLELENASGQKLMNAIAAERNKTKPGNIPVYIQIAKSNDLVKGGNNSGSSGAFDTTNSTSNRENWIEAHAQISSDPTDLGKGSSQGGRLDPVYEASLNVATGAISGRLTGNIRVDIKAAAGAQRGLTFLTETGTFDTTASVAASFATQLDSTNQVAQLIGVDIVPTNPSVTSTSAIGAQINAFDSTNPTFLLTVLEQPGKATKLITSAEPGATNFVPFQPNLLTKRDGRTKMTLNVDLVDANTLDSGNGWQLIGVGNLDRRNVKLAPKDVARMFVGLSDSGSVYPKSLWSQNTQDSSRGDMALTMLGNRTGVAVEGTTGDTLSTITLDTATNNANPAQFAIAFANDIAQSKHAVFFLTKAAQRTNLPAGWSLISSPASLPFCASATANDCVSHMLKVGGSYKTPDTWVVGDTGGNPTLTLGDPMFVFVKGKGVNLN